MTPAEAAALHAKFSGNLIMWFVTLSDPAYPGRAVAYAMRATNSGGMRATNSGGHRLPGELVADTIEEVRTMLPAGLIRHGRSGLDAVGTVEAWD